MLNTVFVFAPLILSAVVIDALPERAEPEKVNVSESSNVINETSTTLTALGYFKNICKNTGHPEIGAYIEKSDAIKSCLVSGANYSQFLSSMSKSTAHVQSHAPEYTEKICRVLEKRNMENCDLMLKVIEPCRGPEELKFDNNLAAVQRSVLEYACENNGEKLTSFLQDNGTDCIVTQAETISNCASLTFMKFEEEQCNKIDEVQSCLLGAFTKCSASLAAALEPLAAHLRKVIPCWNTTQNDTNAVSLEVVTPTEPQQSAAPLQHDGHEPTTIRQLLDVIINTKLEAKNDKLDLFGKYLAASLRSLSKRNSIHAENDVQNILYKYKMKNLDVKK